MNQEFEGHKVKFQEKKLKDQQQEINKQWEKNTRIAIIGYGFVGTATEYFLLNGFDKETFDIQIYDPAKGYNEIDWIGIEYAFICVPTNLKDGKLDTSIIDNILDDLILMYNL